MHSPLHLSVSFLNGHFHARLFHTKQILEFQAKQYNLVYLCPAEQLLQTQGVSCTDTLHAHKQVHKYKHIHMHTHKHANTSTYTCMHTHTHTSTHAPIYVRICTQTHTHIHTHTHTLSSIDIWISHSSTWQMKPHHTHSFLTQGWLLIYLSISCQS